jgi:hypothetical protein
MHLLKLHIDQLHFNLQTLVIRDVSGYDSALPKSNPILQIKSPMMDSYRQVTGLVWTYPFVFSLDSIKLGISTAVEDLQDGIYQINYSLSPNAQVNTTLTFFRVEHLRKLILEKSSQFFYDDTEIDPFGTMKKDKAADIINTCYLGMRAVQMKTSCDAEMVEAYELYDRIVKLIKVL